LTPFGLTLGDSIQCAQLISWMVDIGEHKDDAEAIALEMTISGPLPATTWLDMLRKLSQSKDLASQSKFAALLGVKSSPELSPSSSSIGPPGGPNAFEGSEENRTPSKATSHPNSESSSQPDDSSPCDHVVAQRPVGETVVLSSGDVRGGNITNKDLVSSEVCVLDHSERANVEVRLCALCSCALFFLDLNNPPF
jgi:hypothetical protein